MFEGSGRLLLRILLINREHVSIAADIVKADLVLQTGLQEFKENGLLLDYLQKILIHKPFDTKIPVSTSKERGKQRWISGMHL